MPKQDQPAPEAHLEAKVEQLGIAFEKLGMSPINARVMGFLLLAEPPYKDFYEIRDFLGASKSSISLALNHLMNQGIIDYLTFRGDRRRYFRINTDNWLQKLKQQTLETGSMRLLLEEVLGDVTDYWQVLLGIVLLLVVLFARGGLVGLLAGRRAAHD